MKPQTLPALMAMAVAAVGPVRADPVLYTIDVAHTRVHWETRHFATSTHRGRFDRVQGHIAIDRDARTGEVSITIPTASVSSGVPALDGVLRGKDFLAADAHPQAYFVSRDLRFEAGRLVALHGELTLRGVSRPLTLVARNFACRTDARLQREVCGGDFESRLLRSDFGSTFGLPFVEDSVRLLIAVEGIRQ